MEDHWQSIKKLWTLNTLQDLEHPDGARITLQRKIRTSSVEVNFGVYGLFVHTVFFSALSPAEAALPNIKARLEAILELAHIDVDEALKAAESLVAAY